MARISKTPSQKEKELLSTIADAKRKLEKLQSKQQIEIGLLACKCGLNQFSLDTLEKSFKSLASQLNYDK